MKNLQSRLSSCLLATLALCACNGNDNDNDDNGASVSTAGGASLLPAPSIPGARGAQNPPTLGQRIDRAGRPAITAALVAAFEADPDTQARDVAAYNTSGLSNPAFAPTIRTSLGILDGLDGNCGNQLLADAMAADRYAPLVQVLLDDQLYLNSNRRGSVYLGVEAEAVSRAPEGGGAGGGREPGDDVIARSYSVLAAGEFSGIDDGVPSDDSPHDPDVFPFLAAPR